MLAASLAVAAWPCFAGPTVGFMRLREACVRARSRISPGKQDETRFRSGSNAWPTTVAAGSNSNMARRENVVLLLADSRKQGSSTGNENFESLHGLAVRTSKRSSARRAFASSVKCTQLAKNSGCWSTTEMKSTTGRLCSRPSRSSVSINVE